MISNFIRGFIDGALSTLGVVIGASSGNVSIIIAAGTGGAVANGVSNILGAYTASRADRYREMGEIERAMGHKSLRKSILANKIKSETTKRGIVDGLATVIGGMIPVAPYIAGVDPSSALFVSVGSILGLLFILGLYMGKIEKSDLMLSGIKLVVFGIITAGVVFLLQNVIMA